MGCLKKIIFNILFLILVFCFFRFGGFNWTRERIYEFNNPTREVALKGAEFFGDFSGISSDFLIKRSLTFGKNKKLTLIFKPSGQKVTFFTTTKEGMPKIEDFKSHKIDLILTNLVNENDESKIFSLENFKIKENSVFAKENNNIIYYVIFTSNIKNVPFKKLKGIVGIYSKNDNKSNDVFILSVTDENKFSEDIIFNLFKAIHL